MAHLEDTPLIDRRHRSCNHYDHYIRTITITTAAAASNMLLYILSYDNRRLPVSYT